VVSVGVRANLILGDGACGGLSLGLIHGRTRTSIDVHGGVSSCQNDGHDLSRTVFPAPEKRKVGGSTPPLTATLSSPYAAAHLPERAFDGNRDGNGVTSAPPRASAWPCASHQGGYAALRRKSAARAALWLEAPRARARSDVRANCICSGGSSRLPIVRRQPEPVESAMRRPRRWPSATPD
jgi:hypothetical protein